MNDKRTVYCASQSLKSEYIIMKIDKINSVFITP